MMKRNRKRKRGQIAPSKPSADLVRTTAALFLDTKPVLAEERLSLMRAHWSNAIPLSSAYEELGRFRQRMAATPPEITTAERQALVVATRALAVSQADVLNVVRERLGLVELRARILEEIVEFADVNRGIASLAAARGVTYRTTTDVNRDLPSVTNVELAALALLDEIPDAFKVTDPAAVAYILDASPSGAEIAWLGDHPAAISMRTGFGYTGYLGLGGVHHGVAVAPWRPEVGERFRRLVLLTAQSRDIYRDLTARHGDVARGVGLLRILPENAAGLATLAGKHLVDLWDGRVLNDAELLHLVGLLARVPTPLATTAPFRGVVVPQGYHCCFFDVVGTCVDVVPYSPYLGLEARVTLHALAEDDAWTNRAASIVWRDLLHAIAARCRAREPSLVEAVAQRLADRYGLTLAVFPEKAFRPMPAANAHAEAVAVHHASKVTAAEAAALDALLASFPVQFVRSVRRIEAWASDFLDPNRWRYGIVNIAEYRRVQRTIAMFHDAPFPFESFDDRMLHRWAFSITHELGHAVWCDLPSRLRTVWAVITWAGDLRAHRSLHDDAVVRYDTHAFLTRYAATATVEDFAEHFAAYRFHGDEFRARTVESPAFDRKYAFLRRLYAAARRVETDPIVEYRSAGPYTLADVELPLEKEADDPFFRLHLEQVRRGVDAEELAAETAERVESWEGLEERWEREAAAAEDGDRFFSR